MGLTDMHVLFLGLGHMDSPMAANLVAGGFTVSGFDPGADQCAAAEESGVDIAASLVDGAICLWVRVPTGAPQAQSRVRSTAILQRAVRRSRSVRDMSDSQRRSSCQFSRTSSRSDQNPSASPAA